MTAMNDSQVPHPTDRATDTANLSAVDGPMLQVVFDEVLVGLSRRQKELPAKYFYDARGSDLFVDITRQPEYYPTKCEISLLSKHGASMAECIGADVALLELGSGSSEKTRLLLDVMPNLAAYVPVDISPNALEGAVRPLRQDYPKLRIEPVCADYSRSFDLPDVGDARWSIFYPGSTIGNLTSDDAGGFLRRLNDLFEPGDGFLIGVDLKKSPSVLNAAYNDAAGVTAEFNKNILHHLNRLLDAEFDVDLFEHYAFYAPRRDRVEMHLVAKKAHDVHIGRHCFHFEKGETIHTEKSHKYEVADFQSLLRRAGLEPQNVWLDDKGWFSVFWAVIAER